MPVCADLTTHGLDVADLDALEEFFADHGPYDVAVIAAGMARHRPHLETTSADCNPVMDLNVRVAYFTAREAIAGMQCRGGSIIHVSSQMGLVGGIDRTVYCASKHAVEGMTRTSRAGSWTRSCSAAWQHQKM